MDRKNICICAFIVISCLLCAGCGKSDRETVFAMSDTVSDQDAERMTVDRDTLRAVIEEALASVGTEPVIEVTCSCTGETQVQQVDGEVIGQIGEQAAAGHGAGAEGKGDINTADISALQSLNGIGETRAQAIVSYRESYGAFQSIEDIKQVDGIKDGIFNKIKDEISVG